MKTNGFLLKYPEGKSEIGANGNLPTKDLTVTTWQELKDKRDNGKLIPGSLYRITDYNCTTTQENTKSAGHQFDIVLLALSENKLAEEGWAMEHPTDVYDVTFYDGVTKKCYLYCYNVIDDMKQYNIIDTTTLLGVSGVQEENDVANTEIIIDDTNKTATITIVGGYTSDVLETPDLTYNYFQNSNLSAWKVWYCLDNDKSRFAWADDSVDEGSPEILTLYNSKIGNIDFERDKVEDISGYYAWTSDEQDPYYTNTLTPTTEDNVYNGLGEILPSWSIVSYTPAHEGTGLPNGRGVIYRLIDEWNNDCPYDFKNIQFVRKLTNGVYDPVSGKDGWVYTFTNIDNNNIEDGSLSILNAYNKIILTQHSSGFKLPDIVSIDNDYGQSYNNFNGGINITIHANVSNAKFINCANFALDDTNGAIYINNKKVLTEE